MILRRILLSLTVWSCSVSLLFAEGTELLLSCTYIEGIDREIEFLIDFESNVAKQVDEVPMRIGTLVVEDNAYIISLPKTPQSYEGRIVVYRYSGKATFEYGAPPFGTYSESNVYNTGKCVSNLAEKKF